MILTLDDWHLGYDQIVKDAGLRDLNTVWIFCAPNVDAMAAARILTFMLRADSIPYQLQPCWSMPSLIKTCSTAQETIKSLVLLNFGASVNLTKLFDDEQLCQDAKVYVMDCRKPVHLANIYAGHNVVVFWDETQDKQDLPSDGDNLSGNDSTTDEETGDSSSDDDDDSGDEKDKKYHESDDEDEAQFGDDDHDVVGRARTPPPPAPDVDTDYDGEDEDEGGEEDAENRKRTKSKQGDDTTSKRAKPQNDDDDISTIDKAPQTPAAPAVPDPLQPTPRTLHQQRRNRLQSYYSEGSFYGSPVAWVAYRVASQKRFAQEPNLLWLACIGLTDAYMHSRIDAAGYTSMSIDLKTSVQRIFPNNMVDRVDKTVYAEALTGSTNGVQTQVTLSDNGKIVAETDFRFFLLRHSSLFDSMMYSNYVATRLQVWTNQGKQRLKELLAKMGFPLDECKQPYAFMAPKYKRKLREKMLEYAPLYNLENLEFTSFNRVTGYYSLISASDVSLAVTALLESESQDSFHNALEALNFKGNMSATINGDKSLSGAFGTGLKLAMTLQQNIMSTAMNLVDRNAITTLRHFRFAYITCTSQESKDGMAEENSNKKNGKSKNEKHHVFGQPLALNLLAHWLMDMHRENGKWTGPRSRPLILCAEKPATKSYLIVGYEYPESRGMFIKNHFGQHFAMTCNSMKGNFRLDSFDSHVVEVGTADVNRFLEQLHFMMDSL